MINAPLPNSACAACGGAFDCAMMPGTTTPGVPCWCFALPHGLAIPGGAAGDNTGSARCLCANCLQRQLALMADPTASAHPSCLPTYPPNSSGAP